VQVTGNGGCCLNPASVTVTGRNSLTRHDEQAADRHRSYQRHGDSAIFAVGSPRDRPRCRDLTSSAAPA
jgi:hypothetical protein